MSERRQPPRIVLTMIVKDEAAVAERCVAAIRPLIDAYCIVDTGSTDATKETLARALDGLPGAIHDMPWRDFAHNRSRSLEMAVAWGEYALTIDADNLCHIDPDFDRDAFVAGLDADHYVVEIRQGPVHYERTLLTSTRLPYRYRGVVHEFVEVPPGARGGGLAKGFHYTEHSDGARSKATDTYDRDTALLEAALARNDEPDLRPRYQFYLAQSLRDAGHDERALAAYEARGDITDGWNEERSVAWYEAALLRERLGRPTNEVVDASSRAYDAAPHRAEALVQAARIYREAGRPAAAYPLAKHAADLPEPKTGLFIRHDVYDWRAVYELSIASYWVGRFAEGKEACEQVLANPRLPDPERRAVERNLGLFLDRLAM